MSETIIIRIGGKIIPTGEPLAIDEGEFWSRMYVKDCHNNYNCSHCIELETCADERAKTFRKLFHKKNEEEINKFLNLETRLDEILSKLKYKTKFRNKLICRFERFRSITLKKWRAKLRCRYRSK